MKILFVTTRLPYPIDKGDKLRAFYQLKYLSKSNEVYLFAIDDESKSEKEINVLKEFIKKIKVVRINKLRILLNLLSKLFSKLPFQVAYYYNSTIHKKLLSFVKEVEPDVLYFQLVRSAELANNLGSIPKVIDFVDALSKGIERRMERSNFLMNMILSIELIRLKKYEKKVLNSFDKYLIISSEDKNFLPIENEKEIVVIPNGVDFNFYQPIDSEKLYDILFSGNLNYPPNIDASIFLVKEILPLVFKEMPNVKVLIGGANPGKKVQSLQSKNVDIRGWINDIRDYYKISKVFIAPMRIGTGLQNKILQAMAMKIPCVVSSLAAKGLSNNSKDFILIADTPNEFKENILKLLNNKQYYDTIAEKSYKYVKANYDWTKISLQLENLLQSSLNKD